MLYQDSSGKYHYENIVARVLSLYSRPQFTLIVELLKIILRKEGVRWKKMWQM